MTIKTFRRVFRRPAVRLVVAAVAALLFGGRGSMRPNLNAQGPNPVSIENQQTGDPGWDVTGAGDPSIQGFATDISVNVGDTVGFKIKTDSTNYTIDIFRLGYYGGAGARKVATVLPSAPLPQTQPTCNADATTGLVDCANWGLSASWSTTGAVSGIYLAKPTRIDTGGASHIVFIVRDDNRQADVLMQTSDPTWQAYNQYPGVGTGGASLYCGGPVSNAGTAYTCAGRATKVSYNRPVDTRNHDPQSFLFNAEYPMVRWLEANGYDVKYWAGVDTDRRGADLTGSRKPKAFLSVGHDEYWSGDQRTRIENARNNGVALAFFSGNEMFWKTRYESAYRTLVSYKETLANAKIDLAVDAAGHPIWTGTWRDPRFSPPGDGGRPENGVTGTIWTVNSGTTAITVPASMAHLRFWKNTRVADLTSGSATLAAETLGYEWDEELDNGARPTGIVHLSSTTVAGVEKIVDYGATVGIGTATHNLTLYRSNSGALVFGAGTVQWSWGLDGTHDRGDSPAAHVPDQAMQQATVNLLADMNVRPGTLQAGADPARPLTVSTESTDIFAPTSIITSPASGGQVDNGNRLTISGTATEHGGGEVASVEVSVDGGATWHVAAGTTTWSFDWSPSVLGSVTIRSRAIDDSGNLEAAGPGVTVSVVVGACPCPNIWKPSIVPTNPSAADSNPYELGVKFKSDIDGFITGIRFYKGSANSGTHFGHLWSITGTMLGAAEFTSETTTGWQQVSFANPVAITANTTYVASYHTNVGGYAFDGAYFANAGVDSPPLHALPSNTSGGNGVFTQGGIAFPTSTFNANNYWVDVVFAPSLSDSTPPVISAIKSTTIDSARVTVTWSTDEQATTRIDYGTDPGIITAAISNLPPGTQTVINGGFVTQHTVALSGLQPNTTYYYLITAADRFGNASTVAAPTFTVPGPTLRDTAATDFAAGTQSNTYVSQTVDGEVILAPTTGSEFTGPSLPTGWIEIPWSEEGYSIIDDGVLLVDGARVAYCVTDTDGVCVPGETTTTTPSAVFTAPRSLEFTANFSGDQFQHAGLAQTFGSTSEPWAIFSTLSGGLLFARTNPGGCVDANGCIRDTGLGTGLLGAFHHYRIDWKANSVDYYVDGALVVTHPLTITAPMRPVAASDFNPFGGTVFVDWMRMSSYANAGTFTSRVFDAAAPVDWHSIQWTASTPAGGSVAISVRAGNTPSPDATWSAFAPVAVPGPLALNSQFIQYQAVLTSPDPTQTPALEDIIISTGHAPVAVDDSATVPENGSHTFPPSGPGSLTFNDTDGDLTDVLKVVAVTPPAHGTTSVTASGAVIYTPTPTYSGSDAFTYTVSDGLMTARATVTLDVRFGNIAPVANNDFYTGTEDTTLVVPAASGILANDTDVEHDALTAVLVTLPAHGMLTLSASGGFSYVPVLNYAGPDVFTYRANDGTEDGNVATVTIQVLQVNDPPITAADAFTAVLNQPLDVPAPGVLRNDRDVEVEDTVPLHAQLVSGATHGQLTFRPDGSFSYVPDANYLGIDSFTYAAVDHFNAVGNTSTVTFTVATKAVSEVVLGGATVATGSDVSPADPLQSSVTSPANGTVAIAQGVISASQSPTGYTFLNQQVNITVTGADGAEVTAQASNPIRLRFTIDRSLIPAGQDYLTFQMFRNSVLIPDCLGQTTIPAANLDPCITNREGGAALNNNVRLTIISSHASHWNMGLSTDVLGDLPVAQNDGVYAVDFQAPLIVSAPGVLGNDYGKNNLVATLSGAPVGGTVDLAPSGGFTFTPAAGLCGTASFSYRAVDGTMSSNDGTVSLLVDCTPHAGDDTTTVLEDSGASTITVLSNDSDPDPSQTLTIASVGTAAHGVVAIVGSGIAVSYAPQPNYFGADSFTYTVSDGHNGSATGTVHITVTPVNDAPSFTKGANVAVPEDAGLQTIAGWATNLSAGPANENGQALNFLVSVSNPALFAGQPAIAPSGTLTFTGGAGANGSATVTVQLHDDGGIANAGVDTSIAQTFVIAVTPVNSRPAAVSSSLSATQGVGTAITLSGSDVETAAANLTFTVVAPSHGTVSGTAPNLTYRPTAGYTGPDSLTYTVTDAGDPTGCGAAGLLCAAPMTSAAATVSITVVRADSTTAIQSNPNPSVYGTAVTLTATVTPVPAGSDVLGGSVTFMDGTTTLGVATVNAGVATMTTSGLSAGSHALTAIYSGDSNFNVSTSSSLTQTVSKAAATVTAGNGTKVYGTAADPALSAATATGFTAADALTIALTSTRASGETVGSYATTATATGAAVDNYTVTYLPGTFSITKAAATVTAGSGTKIYGAADPALSSTTVTGFTAADALTIALSSTRTAGEGVGTYATTATATGAATSNYAIVYVAGSFSITKKAATVTPNASGKIYGAADPVLNGTLSGFLAGDSVSAIYSRTAGETAAGGPYTISATLSPASVLGNYAVTYNTANFVIGQAAASVTPAAASKIYGAADPAFTGTLSGFLAADGVSATYSRAAGETVAGGPYAISATLSPASALLNYAITYNTANFTISKAPASVTPAAASKIYGAADPALSGTLSGFQAADGVSASYTRTAGETVAGGPYTISATLSPASALANYIVTSNTASFTINKAAASVTPAAASKTYGAADPALSGTLSGFVAGDGVSASYSRTAGETVAGGPYTISATLSPASALTNYIVTSNTANFTISKAAASVTPAAGSKTYGATDPALTGTLSGFVAADGVSATYSRTAGETVAGGPYLISATLSPASALSNYIVTSNTASFTINKAPASVTPNAASKVYGTVADPALTGTLSGFLAADGVTATYSRAAGNTVAGSPYAISATLSPASVLGNYTITSNTASFTITKAAASVTPNAASKTYGAADPTFTGTLSGFLAADAVTATYSRTAGSSVAGSPYAISAALSPASVLGNYNVTSNTASFTINKAALTVTADNKTRVIGAPNPTLTASYSGLVNGDTPASLTTPPALSTTAIASSPLGTYPITVSGAASGNYTIAYVNGTLTVTPAVTTTVVTSSNSPSLSGAPITLTATVAPVAPSLGVPAGTVTFKDGTVTLGTATLAGGAATITTSTLSTATHSITAVYGGAAGYLASTSAVFSQVISPSAILKVTFAVQALLDNTNKPKVKTVPVPNMLVRVYSTADPCVGNIFSSLNPKRWALTFDGADGVAGTGGCANLTYGTYQAVGTTDVNGNVSIIVPPLAFNFANQYLVIGRATNFDYLPTPATSDPMYSEYPVLIAAAGSTPKVPLSLLATANGKIVPGAQTEFFGSYLNIIQPEYMDWTENQEQYPIVLVAEGDWALTTSVTPPEGFVPDATAMSTQVADTTSAVQFTMTDVGSDWTETAVNHTIVHLGETKMATTTIPMFDKKATTAKNDSPRVMHDSAATVLNLMANDKVNHARAPITITAITSALNGTAVLAGDGLTVSYTPNPGYSGVDTFTYTVTDAIGGTSTGTVSVSVLATPAVSVRPAVATEGNTGTTPVTVNVVLSNPSTLPVTVNYSTVDGTAVAGIDYVAASGTVTFVPGDVSEPITLQAMGDTLAEFDEHFTVALNNPTNATIAAAPGGDITIADDDPPEVSIVPTASALEGNAGTSNVALAVTLSQPHNESVWVSYTTVDGTAVAGSDYIRTTGTLQFFPGAVTSNIYVPITGDKVGETNEMFYVDISNPLNGTLTAATRATVTILNDDVSTTVFTTTADFASGTLGSGAYLSETADGELTVAPAQAAEFSGASLPAGWTSTALVAGGGATVGSGKLAIDGAALVAPTASTVGQTLEFVATFGATANQNIGFGTTGEVVSPMAMFIIRANGLYARSVNGTRVVENLLAGIDWKNKPHRFQITTAGTTANYYIDGTLMMTHTAMAWGTAAMRPVINDAAVGDGALGVDWIQLSPYTASGTYTSAVFDAGSTVAWQKLTTTNTILPYFSCCTASGTTTTITYRTGDTPTPDATWTSFTALGTGGALTGSSRYVQYMIQMTSNGVKAPAVQDVSILYKK